MSRLSLQVGHLTFMSLILLSLPMKGGPSREIIQYQSTELGKGDRKEKRRAVDRQGVEFQGSARADLWGYQDCHRSALAVRMSCSRSILASTLSRRPPS